MVSSVYKWLGSSFFSVFLLAAGNYGFSDSETPLRATRQSEGWERSSGELHPFHVSVVEIEHNATDKTLEISCKIFTDDFETILAKNYKTKVDLINPPNKAAMDTLVKKYILSHLSIKANGKPAVMDYVGFENDKEAAFGYFEIDNIQSVSKVDIVNTILYDKYDDQVSIMHVKVNGNRKSTKLDYPDKEASFSF